MPTEIVIEKRADGTFVPATEEDAEIAQRWKVGEAMKVDAVMVRARSLRHHKLFFALLKLTLQYWDSTGGTITPREQQFARIMAKYLDNQTGGTAISAWVPYFLDDLAKSRADKMPPIECTVRELRKWVLVEAGYFEIVKTPDGIERKAISISFNNMGQDKFNEVYKACFSVCWRLALSHPFASEADAQEAVEQLLAMG